MTSIDKIFTKYSLVPGSSQEIQLGNLQLGIKRKEQGWFILPVWQDEISQNPGKEEFYQTGVSDNLILAPALQIKPLVFKGNGLIVSPMQKLQFFIKIPLIIQVYHASKKIENLLTEIPCQRLSDTWFGEPDKGEAAYAIGSEFSLTFADLNANNFEVICPVNVFNNFDKQLELQRLIIRVENLTLFQNKDKIISSLIKIEYKGKDSISEVSYSSSKLFHGEKQHVLAKPRMDGANSSLKINFHFIKNIYKNI